MPFLTVFTPTYNRAYTLHKCYESLRRQTCKDFIWMVVDDGSTDETAALIKEWQSADNGFEIRYFHKENGGMHSAHNLAYENIKTELNTCIDSDDYMPDDAVAKIKNFWMSSEKDDSVSGFLALDAYEDGSIIGTAFPENLACATYYEYYYKAGVKGDKKFILRSELTKLYPYPVFEDEKYLNLATNYCMLDLDYKLLNLNEVVCIVEYLQDGSTKNMYRQYMNNPKGFSYSRRLCMSLPYADFPYRLRQCVHYISSCLISKNKNWLSESPKKALTLLCAPAGFLLWLFILVKHKR